MDKVVDVIISELATVFIYLLGGWDVALICLVIVMLSVLVDRVTGNTGAIRTLVIYYFVANEGLSILENLGQAGIPIPKGIKKALKILKDQNNDLL